MTTRARASTDGSPRVGAAIDCGSNSVHLLVAVIDRHRVRPLADESTFLGLGAAAGDGEFGPTLINHLTATIIGYVRLAQTLGAAQVVIVGTEPFRRAADAREAFASMRTATGLRPATITHAEEALLTLVGVTGGRRVKSDLLVCDIGGGSTELATVGPRRKPAAFGFRAGSASLTDRHVRHDPPTGTELRALRAAASQLVAGAPDIPRSRLVAVGGSATNMLRVLPVAGLDRVLTPARLDEIRDTLATEPTGLAAERHGISPIRARLLPAGVEILSAILRRYEADQAEVSDLGIREGLILVTTEAGGEWRRQLRKLAAGWGVPAPD